MLILFGGLPGTGKSTLAPMLAESPGATDLRINTIERAITESNHAIAIRDDGYRVAYAVPRTTFGWVARLSGMQSILCASHVKHGVRSAERVGSEIEVLCSDPHEHRRRIETRVVDIPATWDEVVTRNSEAWTGNHISIDTAGQDIAQSFAIFSFCKRACVSRTRAQRCGCRTCGR
jgi:predicted kinase